LPHNKSLRYAGALAALVVVLFASLEWKHSFYFTQDDNRCLNLPMWFHNLRAVTAGEIPELNFHQYSGAPFLANGLAASLYPPGYAAAALSKLVFGNLYFTIDFLVAWHLLVGALGIFALITYLTGDWRPGFWAGVAFPFCSYAVYLGACWVTVTGPIAYFPWMLFFALRTIKAPRPGNVAGLLAARLLLFCLGYFQLFVYASIFEILVVLAAFRFSAPEGRRARALLTYAASWILVGALSAPLLLPMAHQANSSAFRKAAIGWEEFSEGGLNVYWFLAGLLNPFSSFYENERPEHDLNRVVPYLSHISYAGVLLLIFGAIAFFKRHMDEQHKRPFFLLFNGGLLSFCWGENVFAVILYFVPILNRFRWPFKIQVLTSFFFISAAAIGLACLLRLIPSRRAATALFAAVVAATVGNYLVLYLCYPPRLIRQPAEALPLAEPLSRTLGEGKIVSLGYTPYGWSADSLGADYATLLNLYHISGYDPVISDANLESALGMHFVPDLFRPFDAKAVAHLRQWGVQWYVVAAYSKVYPEALARLGMEPIYRDAHRIVFKDAAAMPFFFWQEGGGAGIGSHLGINAFEVHTARPIPGRLTMNFVANPFYSAQIDGLAASLSKNGFGQMTIAVPAGAHRITVRYRDPYLRAGFAIAGLSLLIFCGWAAYQRYALAAPPA
jgi:hypothetical protein